MDAKDIRNLSEAYLSVYEVDSEIGIISELTGGKGHPGYKAGSRDLGPMQSGHPADTFKRTMKGGTMSQRHGYHLGDLDDKDDDEDDLEAGLKDTARKKRENVRKPLRDKVRSARKVLSKEAFNIFINTMISEGMNFDSYSWDDLYEMFDNIFEADVANKDPDAYERRARASETRGQSAERRVRDRLATMDPDKKAAMIKQMRAVGLNV